MGSEYILYEKDGVEIQIDEMSNELDLFIMGHTCEEYKHTRQMSPAEMLKIFM